MEQCNKSILFYEICRLCLEEHGHSDIFDRNDLQENILRCFGLKVSLTDSLPQKICAKCLEIVTKAAELRTIAKRNDEHLKRLIKCPESDAPMDICQEDDVENVKSTHFDGDEETSEEINPVIKKFISVRKDLFESSVSEDSVIKNDISQHKRGAKRKEDYGKIVKCENGVTIYRCIKCPKEFNEWKKLYLHNRLHNKNYRCPIVECGKRFATKGDLIKHLRTHTGEKPYECDLCDKCFAQRVTLKNHKETVHSEGDPPHTKKYICSIVKCDKKFATKGDLEKHTRAHTGEMPYDCDPCDKSFAQQVTLKNHKGNVDSSEGTLKKSASDT